MSVGEGLTCGLGVVVEEVDRVEEEGARLLVQLGHCDTRAELPEVRVQDVQVGCRLGHEVVELGRLDTCRIKHDVSIPFWA